MSRARVLVAAFGICAAVTTVLADPAAAAPPITPGATAFSVPVFTGSATVHPSLALSGSLGGLLDGLIGPIVANNLTPLTSALQSLSLNTMVSSAVGIGSAYTAGTPAFQTTPGPTAFPADAVPPAGCGVAAGLPCYNASTGLSPALGPLASLSITKIAGYTQQVQSSADATLPMFGRAQVTAPSVTVLPAIPTLTSPLVSTGLVDAKATCPNDGSDPSADGSAPTVSALNGLVTFTVASGNIATLTVNGVAYGTVDALTPVSLSNGITVGQFLGTAVKITVPLTAAQVLGALGLPSSVVTTLLGDAPTSTLALGLVVGPTNALTKGSAVSSGLTVGVDLTGSLGFTLLGLVGATVSVPSGISGSNYGNVLDLRMAYTTCTTGAYAPLTSKPVPAAMV